MKAAIIGLGRMGSGIARCVATAHRDTHVFDLDPQKTAAMGDVAQVSNSAREAAANADIVVLSLYDDKSVISSLAGDDGVLAGLRPKGIIINATTISANAAREADKISRLKGCVFLHGPVLGRPEAAAAGQLLTFLGGEEEGYQRALPIVESYTRKAFYVGADAATAARSKLLMNYVVASVIDLMGQAFAFAEKAQIDPLIVQELLNRAMPSPPYMAYCERIRTQNFDDPGFTLRLGLKDIDLMLQMSSEVEAPLPNAGPIHDRIVAALAHGYADSDWCSWTQMSRMSAGLIAPDPVG